MSTQEHVSSDELTTIDQLYRHLHANPELSYREEKTSERLAKEMRAAGYTVTEKVGRHDKKDLTGYGVVAVMQNGSGPTVLIRTDMDALPVKENTGADYASRVVVKDELGKDVGVMHACGHDIHMAVWVGVARRLSQIKNKWKGTVVFIAQPAEERGAGAKAMLKDGLYTRFPKPDYALALHVDHSLEAGKVGYTSGYTFANVDSVDITIRGIGGHGAYPHTAKDPIVIASQVVLALQTIVSREVKPTEPAVVTVGSIHGGTKHNIIPDHVTLQLTVRSYSDEVRNQLLKAIERITVNIARAAGVPEDRLPTVTVSDEYTPSTYNDPALVERTVKVFETALGKDNVIKQEPVMGGEDFGYYGREGKGTPIFMFRLGTVGPERMKKSKESGARLPSIHSPEFLPDREATLRAGIQSMTTAALELLKK